MTHYALLQTPTNTRGFLQIDETFPWDQQQEHDHKKYIDNKADAGSSWEKNLATFYLCKEKGNKEMDPWN